MNSDTTGDWSLMERRAFFLDLFFGDDVIYDRYEGKRQ